MSFDSLEDNFLKKANDTIKTDVQKEVEFNQKEVSGDEKITYEDDVKKNKVIGGLAALFQKTIKQAKEQENDDSDSTVYMSTDNVKYSDNFIDATNYVSEKDIQRFMPGDIYNDSIKEPELENGKVQIDQRHSPVNKYDDTLEFEPSIASEKDISPQSSISRSLDADTPLTDDDISKKIIEHNNKKQFAENTWSPNNSYNSGPTFTEGKSDSTDTDTVSHETELTQEEYERNLKDSHDTETDSE
jgi:hypothetical protein